MAREKNPENQLDELRQRKKDYVNTFTSEAGKKVLEDLEKMCFINKTTFAQTAERTLLNEGTRLVIIHIKNMINFDLETLIQLAEKEE